MSNHSQFYSVIRAQWQHIGFSDVHKIRHDQANENKIKEDARLQEKASVSKRELVDQE